VVSDVASLRLSFVVVAVTMLLLFYFVTFRSTRSAYCGWWCVALLMFLTGSAAYLLDGSAAQWWANPAGSALLVLGAASAWAGARSLRTAPPPLWQLLAFPLLVAALAATDDPGTNTWAGGSLYLFALSALLGLCATELWRLDHGRRAVTTALMFSAALASAFHVLRLALYLTTGPDSEVFAQFAGSGLATLVNTVLLVVVSYTMTALSNDQSTSDLRRRATHDGLTNLLNHTEFLARAEVELHHVRRTGSHASLILADLDLFKSVNDTYGHPVGDRVLETFASVCMAAVRSTDLVGRYGGEEYIVFLPGSDARTAAATTTMISQAMAQIELVPGLRTSASYGIAEVGDSGSLTEIIAAADAALYQAKAAGRDRAVVAGQPAPPPATSGP
jgi:diguanylate cyclase (GGDEF)-like protein